MVLLHSVDAVMIDDATVNVKNRLTVDDSNVDAPSVKESLMTTDQMLA